MVFCRQATRYSDKITLKHLQRMTFVQIEVEFFRVNSYFIDNLDTQNKQRQMRPLCGSLERFLDTKGHRYSKDVTTIEIVFFCGRYFKARLRPKYIEGKVVKNWRDRDLDMYFSRELKINIDLNAHCKEFFEADKMGSYNIIARTTMEYVSTMPLPVKIRKTFDRELFVNDLREFFVSIGCDV